MLYWSYNNASGTRKYWTVGGICQTLTIEFYTDTSFDPTATQRIKLSGSSNYPYSFKAYSADQGMNEHSYFIEIDFDLLNAKLTNPTCFTAMLSGTSVVGPTVKMGEYSTEQIRNGATPIPFNILLQSRVRMTNIETKLVSMKVGTENERPLSNALIGNDAARGVGVLIESLATNKSPLMILKPNDSSSVYKDCNPGGKDDITGGVYPDQSTDITYPLHFQATLQQDGTMLIEVGEFRATSIFQVTYP